MVNILLDTELELEYKNLMLDFYITTTILAIEMFMTKYTILYLLSQIALFAYFIRRSYRQHKARLVADRLRGDALKAYGFNSQVMQNIGNNVWIFPKVKP